jgi:phosphate transport system substrate-binding protein
MKFLHLSLAGLAAAGLLSRLCAAEPDPALPPYQPAAQVSGSAVGTTGMDSVEAMFGAWNEAFKKYHPGADFTIRQIDTAPEERIGLGPNTDEVFHPDNQAYEDKYGYEPFRVKICMGAFVLKSHVSAIGVFVNKANPISHLALAKLDAVYSAERRRGYPADITTWGQLGLGGEWADKPIHIYGFYWRDDVVTWFRKLVMLDAPFKDAYRVPGEDMTRNTPKVAKDLMAAIAADPGAIGYANFSYQTDGVKAIGLSDANDVLGQPTMGDIAAGRYPLERFLYIYVNRRPGKPLDPLFKEFLTFVLSREGQASVAKDHYLPLTAEIAAAERAKLE